MDYKKDLVNFEALENVGRLFLEMVDDNPDREGLKETPKRFAKYWTELLEGQKYTNEEIAKMFDKCFEDEYVHINAKGLVVERDISVFSTCEHHIALMFDMKVNIAYIPNGKVIGLSKMSRICEMCAKRLQLQEKLAQDIAEVMQIILGTEDIAVHIIGKHACMTARGIKSREAFTDYTYLSGRFFTNSDLRNEFEMALARKLN